MNEVFRLFERNMVLDKRFDAFSDLSTKQTEQALKLLETGFCYPIAQRDEEGRKILIFHPERFDAELYTMDDAMRLLAYILNVLVEEEETQIAGFITITDYANATLKQLVPPSYLIDLLEISTKAAPMRQKGHYNVNLPIFAYFIIEIARSIMSEKLKKRLFLMKSSEDLSNHFNISVLPQHCGGIASEAENIKAFLKLRDEKLVLINNSLNIRKSWINIPVDKLWNGDDEDQAVGSFRKLDID